MININPTPRRFPLGTVFVSPGVTDVCGRPYILWCLFRHQCGDWGVTDEADRRCNDEAVKSGERILSTYPIDPAKPSDGFVDMIWIVTEGDRSSTTICLPLEY